MKRTETDRRKYLRNLLEHSPDGVFTIDTELMIRYVNPAFCRMLGYSAAQLIGTSVTTYLGDLNILGICMAEVQSSGHCNDQETIFKRADGSIVHISKNVQAIYDDEFEIREILVTLRDLTELHALNSRLEIALAEKEAANLSLRQTLDQLRETQKQLILSEKMAALGSLVAGMAHEINTPIGIGVTSASSIREETQRITQLLNAGSMKRSDLEAYLQHMTRGCNILHNNLSRAAELVGSFKQVAVDQSRDEWRTIELRTYLEEIFFSLNPSLKRTNIEVRNECPPGLHLYVNPGAIYQIISNLVMNAIVHAFPNNASGTITVSATHGDKGFTLHFSDNGAGIAAENLSRIFDPFFTTRRGQGGSGLGLNIVYNLITSSLGGHVAVDSVLGQGTRFTIDLPLVQEKAA